MAVLESFIGFLGRAAGAVAASAEMPDRYVAAPTAPARPRAAIEVSGTIPRAAHAVTSPARDRALPRLPSIQGLVTLTLREIEIECERYRDALRGVSARLQTLNASPTAIPVEQCRRLLYEANVSYLLRQGEAVARLAARHHGQGLFGSLIGGLPQAIAAQFAEIQPHNQQLGELAAEPDVAIVVRSSLAIAGSLAAAHDRLQAILAKLQRQIEPGPSAPRNSVSSLEAATVRRQLAQALARWWETHPGLPESLGIALLGADQLQTLCQGLDRAGAERILSIAARLVAETAGQAGSSFQKGREALALETQVHTRQGEPRTIAWACTIVSGAAGRPDAVIATGLDRTPHASRSQLCHAPRAEAGDAKDRRRTQRDSYSYVQLIAPLAGDGLPPLSEFCEVLCHDLSQDGFAFLSAAIPTAAEIVVGLGTSAPHVFMKARLVRFVRLEQHGQMLYKIGCQFIGRAPILIQSPCASTSRVL